MKLQKINAAWRYKQAIDRMIKEEVSHLPGVIDGGWGMLRGNNNQLIQKDEFASDSIFNLATSPAEDWSMTNRMHVTKIGTIENYLKFTAMPPVQAFLAALDLCGINIKRLPEPSKTQTVYVSGTDVEVSFFDGYTISVSYDDDTHPQGLYNLWSVTLPEIYVSPEELDAFLNNQDY